MIYILENVSNFFVLGVMTLCCFFTAYTFLGTVMFEMGLSDEIRVEDNAKQNKV